MSKNSIIPEIPDKYHTMAGQDNKGILDELRTLTKLEMQKIHKSTEAQA
jgi:hypothetical protein